MDEMDVQPVDLKLVQLVEPIQRGLARHASHSRRPNRPHNSRAYVQRQAEHRDNQMLYQPRASC